LREHPDEYAIVKLIVPGIDAVPSGGSSTAANS
jgi:hypothetical protein